MLERKVELMDTTLRDGEQTKNVSFSPKERLFLTEYLYNLGVKRIEIASATNNPSPEDTLAVAESVRWAKKDGCLDSLEVLCFMKGKEEGGYAAADWVSDTGCKNINLLAKGSSNHVDVQFKENNDQYLARLSDSIVYARSKGLNVRMYLEAWSEAMQEDPRFVYDTTMAAAYNGVKRFILCDTMGILSPEKASELVKRMVKKFPKLEFEFHGHNDYGLAVANSCAAVSAGAVGVNATALGLGERAGNADIFLVHAALKDLYGYKSSLDESRFREAQQVVCNIAKVKTPPNYPIFGGNVLVHVAGAHTDGHSKGNIYTNRLFSARFGPVDIEYVLNKGAGTKTIKKHLDELGIHLDKDGLEKLTMHVRELDKVKRLTRHDILFMLQDVMGSDTNGTKLFYFTDYNIESSKDMGSHASFKAIYKGRRVSGFGRGNGPVNAFMNAVRDTVIFEENPDLENIAIYDYAITTPTSARSESIVRCWIEWQYNGDGKRFDTNGYHTNQDFAPIEAVEKMINMELYLKKKEDQEKITQQV